MTFHFFLNGLVRSERGAHPDQTCQPPRHVPPLRPLDGIAPTLQYQAFGPKCRRWNSCMSLRVMDRSSPKPVAGLAYGCPVEQHLIECHVGHIRYPPPDRKTSNCTQSFNFILWRSKRLQRLESNLSKSGRSSTSERPPKLVLCTPESKPMLRTDQVRDRIETSHLVPRLKMMYKAASPQFLIAFKDRTHGKISAHTDGGTVEVWTRKQYAFQEQPDTSLGGRLCERSRHLSTIAFWDVDANYAVAGSKIFSGNALHILRVTSWRFIQISCKPIIGWEHGCITHPDAWW